MQHPGREEHERSKGLSSLAGYYCGPPTCPDEGCVDRLGRRGPSSLVGDVTEYLLFIFLGSIIAGVLGAIAGLGGGVLVVPMLTIGFGVDIHYAVGASIVSVIATSSGAIVGAVVAGIVHAQILFIIFGVVLASSVLPIVVRLGEELPHGVRPDAWSTRLRLGASYYDAVLKRVVSYQATRVPLGLAMMWLAGAFSGLLGIGSGAFKVLAMDTAMRLPMKVSTTTSNFMIGVTAAASAGIYFGRGDINPLLAAPVALGVLLGAGLGTRLLVRLHSATLRKVFVPLVLVIALEMILRGVGVQT